MFERVIDGLCRARAIINFFTLFLAASGGGDLSVSPLAYRGHRRVGGEKRVDNVLQQLVCTKRLPGDRVLDHQVGKFLHVA